MNINDVILKIKDIPDSAFFYTPDLYNRPSFLFLNPAEILQTDKPEDFNKIFKEIDKFSALGYRGYGVIPYETGYLLEKRLKPLWKYSGQSIIKFCFFKKNNMQIFKPGEIKFPTPDAAYNISKFVLNTTKNEYIKNIKAIKKHIERGDTYQVNYTVKGRFLFSGDISALFYSLVFNQSARYTALINNNEKLLISLSPELFFEQKNNTITAKPMKGTVSRGYNSLKDTENKYLLKFNDNNKAENLMILDLLRNDLGKISKYGKVTVNKFYEIEKYESLFQMTSTVKSLTSKNTFTGDVIKNIFPCGSVTGTPKIRTMQIINNLEKEPRGVYTGAIGIINRNRSIFNVAIRTIELNKELDKGTIGLGSGIVWDSIPEDEYNEVILKSKFLTDPQKYFEIYETMLIEKQKIFLYEEHIKRLQEAASYFLFKFTKKKIENELLKIISPLHKRKRYRFKIILDKWGNLRTELTELNEIIDNVKVIISAQRVRSNNKFQYFKTTQRDIYDNELKKYARKYWDVIFFNEKGELAEGARTNIFIRKNNVWFTPPLEAGILNGIYRNYMLSNNNNCKESVLYKKDLMNADEVVLTNSLRKIIHVKSIAEK